MKKNLKYENKRAGPAFQSQKVATVEYGIKYYM